MDRMKIRGVAPPPLHPAEAGMSKITIPVNGVYFDQIAAGTKLEEYRLVTPFWSKRLTGRSYDRIVLTRGYPKADDASRRLERPWRGYVVKTITHPHFGAEPVEVFAINVAPEPLSDAPSEGSESGFGNDYRQWGAR